MKFHVISIAILSLQVKIIYSLEKFWQGNVDWDDPNNWKEKKIPELDSLLVFPIEMRHSVGMPKSAEFTFTGIELPRDGIIALSENGKIKMKEKSNTDVKESYWLRDTAFYWVDPLNWNGSSEAVPHVERLPCQSDIVVLPESSRTFNIRLPISRDVEVQGVRLADYNYTLAKWEWKYMKERLEFSGDVSSVKYSPLKGCQNCRCQESDAPEYSEEVCNIQRPRCEPLTCEYPLKVVGHCCFYCGGRIKLSDKILLNSVRRVAERVLKSYEGIVSWYSRLTWDGQEILITENKRYEGFNTISALTEVERALKEEGMEVLYIETSGSPLYDHRLAIALGPVVGGFLLLLILTLLLFPIFGYTYSQVWQTFREVISIMCTSQQVKGRRKKSFAFARFENLSEGAVQLAEEEGDDTNTRTTTTSTGERFENPLYRSTKKKTRCLKGQETRINPDEPVSLASLEKAVELDHTEDIEMDIENL